MHSFKTLVEQVKRAQRTSIEIRETWHKLCDLHRGGMRDPKQLDAAFLDYFLRSVEEEPVKGNNQTSWQRSALTSRVDTLRKTSSKLQRAWERACDVECGGVHDPEKLDVAFLQRFLVKYGDSTTPSSTVAEHTLLALPEQVEWVKRAQKSSEYWREEWQVYCDKEGRGMRDPAQLSAGFVQRFLDRVEAEASKGALNPSGERGISPAELVNSVKDLQRTSAEWKDSWQRLCDGQGLGHGMCDPPLQSSSFLQAFLNQAAYGATAYCLSSPLAWGGNAMGMAPVFFGSPWAACYRGSVPQLCGGTCAPEESGVARGSKRERCISVDTSSTCSSSSSGESEEQEVESAPPPKRQK